MAEPSRYSQDDVMMAPSRLAFQLTISYQHLLAMSAVRQRKYEKSMLRSIDWSEQHWLGSSRC